MNFDLIVIGGGPVGLAMARAVRGVSVALLAQERPASSAPPALDARVYALSPGNAAFLRDIGVWDKLDATRIAPIHSMRVYGDAPASCIEFDAYRAGVPALAWTVEDSLLQAAMFGALQGHDGMQLVAPSKCESIQFDLDAARVKLGDGRELSAALVVAADGANSFVRAQSRIEVASSEYGQAAIVANFDCDKAHANVAYQWFQGGPVLAALPLPGRRVSMIWSLPAAEAARIVGLEPDALCRSVEHAMNRELGALALATAPRTYPLRRLSARRLVAPRVALVGDAAHVIHPLAGQGLNLGLQDVRALAGLITGRAPVRNLADPLLLRAYERQRSEPILAMDFMVDGLFRLFGARNAGLARFRNAGLNLTDRLPVVKNVLIRRAMA